MFMDAMKVGVAQNEIKRKPKEIFRNVSLLMLCACQQAEPVLTSTTPHSKSQQRTTGYTTHSASLFSHHHRQSPRECDADHQRMTTGTAADRYQRQPVTHPGSGFRSWAREKHKLQSRWIVQAPHLPAPDPCISCSPVAPIRREPFSNPTLSWALKTKTSCLFANFCCFSMFWKMWTSFLQPGFIYSRPNHLTFCKQFCFGGWMKCIYLAAQATWVATAKQRNYLCSQQGEGTANYAILDKYQLSEHVLLTPRPVSFLPSFQSKMLKYLKKGTFQGDFTFIITAIRFQLEKRH